jgi:MoaA/NifB/PqqE/SkfB family radical SAM enzyme
MGYKSNVGRGCLRMQDFKNIVDANPCIRRVELDNIGEMFLNPDLLSIIEYAHKRKLGIACNTGANLNYATPEVLEGLVKYGFRTLTCSIDGASNETYKIYRVGGDLDGVMENIRLINSFKAKHRSRFPELKWQFIVFGHNEHEIPQAKKIARDLKMSFFAKMAWDPDYSPVRDRGFVMAHTGWRAVTRNELEELTGKGYVRNACYSLWRSPRINWDGRVLGCCWNVWSEFGGNVFRDGYLLSINSEKIDYAKKMLSGKEPSREDIPCSTCDLYLKIKTTGNYIKGREIFRYILSQCRSLALVYRKSGLKRIMAKILA